MVRHTVSLENVIRQIKGWPDIIRGRGLDVADFVLRNGQMFTSAPLWYPLPQKKFYVVTDTYYTVFKLVSL